MLKCLLLLSVALIPGNDVIVTLKTCPCTGTRIAYMVPNNGVNPDGSPMVIDYISVSNNYGRVTASINGVSYDSGLYAIYPVPLNIVGVQLHDSSNNLIAFSGQYTHWTTLNQSGHNFYVQHWRLDSGTITYP